MPQAPAENKGTPLLASRRRTLCRGLAERAARVRKTFRWFCRMEVAKTSPTTMVRARFALPNLLLPDRFLAAAAICTASPAACAITSQTNGFGERKFCAARKLISRKTPFSHHRMDVRQRDVVTMCLLPVTPARLYCAEHDLN